MGINAHKIRKWVNMMCGNSVYHVKQDEGKYYSKTGIKGYYNNLTEKVSRFGEKGLTIPKVKVDSGEEIYLSTAVFQYGLGAYDLYLETGEKLMLQRMIVCADWAVKNQEANGGWKTFEFENKIEPYSSMTQGEGTSLLLRAYRESKDNKYLDASRKAIYFMIKPISDGGTALFDGADVYLYEYTYEPLILNGWIFSFWGLWDYCIECHDQIIEKLRDRTLVSIIKKIPEYDIGYWSKYEDGRRICSPFYHNLHIAQLKVMYDLTGEETFNNYALKWEQYARSRYKRTRAFITKVFQKILE